MEQRDYLTRQFEQLGIVLGKLLSKILNIKGNGPEAIAVVNSYFAEDVGLDLAWLCMIDDDQLIFFLQNTICFGRDDLDKLANLLTLVAERKLTHENGLLTQKCSVIRQYLAQCES